jgi:hypothetical protein
MHRRRTWHVQKAVGAIEQAVRDDYSFEYKPRAPMRTTGVLTPFAVDDDLVPLPCRTSHPKICSSSLSTG